MSDPAVGTENIEDQQNNEYNVVVNDSVATTVMNDSEITESDRNSSKIIEMGSLPGGELTSPRENSPRKYVSKSRFHPDFKKQQTVETTDTTNMSQDTEANGAAKEIKKVEKVKEVK